MSYAAMAGDVMETLSAQGALPASLLGHSMGGKVAMLAALSQPLLVSRLIVADIAPIAYSHHNARVAAALLALDLSPGLDRQRAAAALEADVPDPAVRGFLLQNLEFGGAPRWKIGLHQIAAGIAGIEGWPNLPDRLIYRGPALFLAGGKSDYVPPACVPAITARFPRAVLQVLDGAGHWLHAEQPAAFGDAVENFLAAEHSDTSF
jgi:pimeloyl-ACP methyl ester carboxylesterase